MQKPRKNKSLLACLALLLALCFAVPLWAGELKPVPEALVSPKDNPTTEAKVQLGKSLFFDRRLSGDGTMACATCHAPDMGFSDNLPISQSYPTTRNWRNSQTLVNVAFNKSYFNDGRAASLEQQALFPMMSAFEMNQNLDYVEEELKIVPEYAKAFEGVFGGPVTRERIAMALAAFERTLVSRGSQLDKYLLGDKSAMSVQALAGYQLFVGKAGCARCHFDVNLSDGLFHATLVPDNKSLTGDPRMLATARFVGKVSGYKDYENLKEDPGRYLVTKRKEDWKAFRTPTLRDVALSGPYMHNGVFSSLAEVVEFYDLGGGMGNQELKPLGLSEADKAALVSFLSEALTGNPIEVKNINVP